MKGFVPSEGIERRYSAAVVYLKAGNSYDAFSLYRTIFDRLIDKGKYEEASEMSIHFAGLFVGCGDFACATDAACKVLMAYEKSLCGISDEKIATLIELVEMLTSKSGDHGTQFFESATAWTNNRTTGSDTQQLHKLIGKSYAARGKYGLAQQHLVSSKSIENLMRLIIVWREEGYPNERHLFALRMILVLLSRGDVVSARQLSAKCIAEVENDDNDTTLPPELQLGTLLTHVAFLSLSGEQLREICSNRPPSDFVGSTCQIAPLDNCHVVWTFLVKKYRPLLTRDPTLNHLVKLSEEFFFAMEEATENRIINGTNTVVYTRRPRTRTPNVGSTLTNLINQFLQP